MFIISSEVLLMANNDYLNLVEFWNNGFLLNEEDKKELAKINPDEDWKSLSPSENLFNAIASFKAKNNVLDYGCGSGWASIVMAKSGVKKITAVDVASNSKDMVDCYAKAFKVEQQIKTFAIDENWLKNQKEATWDGFYCSNVIDVVPLDMAEEIIKESARVTHKDALVIFSLNYYADLNAMEERGFETKDKSVYINGVLRLTSLTDEEWTLLFKKYYQNVELSYFSWPGETKETRRVFIVRK